MTNSKMGLLEREKEVLRLIGLFIENKFKELDNAVSIIDKDNEFWILIKSIKLKIRFTKSTAITIWTKGGFITGDFYDKVYYLEVAKKDIK